MRNFEFFLDRLSRIRGIEITCYAYGQFWDIHASSAFNPVRVYAPLRKLLQERCDTQDVPVLYRDPFGVFWACIRMDGEELPEDTEARERQGIPKEPGYYFLGPATTRPMDMTLIHRYYRFYGQENGTEQDVPLLSLTAFLSILESAALLLSGIQYTDENILTAAGLGTLLPEQEQAAQMSLERMELLEEEAGAHHSYEEERRILQAVRDGNGEEAVELSMRIDERMPSVSARESVNWERRCVSAVTLCTRAAIESGLSPAKAYRISDEGLRQLDQCSREADYILVRNRVILELAGEVHKHHMSRKYSSYVSAAVDYIDLHYREKITAEEIASRLGVSTGHLSRLFHRQMGESLQEYIVHVRVEKAANLLRYSDESITRISDYVGFTAQSYFSSTFRRLQGITPSEYRSRYQPAEFVGRSHSK